MLGKILPIDELIVMVSDTRIDHLINECNFLFTRLQCYLNIQASYHVLHTDITTHAQLTGNGPR